MPRYCLDTSGISNPLETLPEDIFGVVWEKVIAIALSGAFCCTKEIADEIEHIEGFVGASICGYKVVFEIGQDHWDWPCYIKIFNRMKCQYQGFISEYNGGRKGTVGVADLSIVALAKTIQLPVVSMEGSDRGQTSFTKMRIPRLCALESVEHLDFNEMLRREGGL